MKTFKSIMKSQVGEIKDIVSKYGHDLDTNTRYGLGVFVNGIKLEWNANGSHIKIGYGCHKSDNDAIEKLFLENGFDVTRSKGGLVIVHNNPTVENFEETYEIIIGHNIELKSPQRSKRGRVEFNNDAIFLKVAKVVKLSVDEGLPQLMSRGAGIFDSIDNMITIGESINRTTKNSYREHVVPCNLLLREAVEMYRDGSSLQDIAIMFQQNCFIVLITPEEAHLLDSTLKLKVDMPLGWKIGDDPLARLRFAKIDFKKY